MLKLFHPNFVCSFDLFLCLEYRGISLASCQHHTLLYCKSILVRYTKIGASALLEYSKLDIYEIP